MTDRIDVEGLANRLERVAHPAADEAAQSLRALQRENDELRAANQSARVCAKHVSEFAGIGCLVCDNAELTAHLESLQNRYEQVTGENAEMLKTLSEAIDCIEDVAAMPVSAAVASFRTTLEKLNHAQERNP